MYCRSLSLEDSCFMYWYCGTLYIIRRFTPSWTLYRHEKLLIFIRVQPSSWEKSIHCVCPGDYFISSVTGTGQFMVEMSIFFFLWIIIRQFGDANTNRAIISLANIVREFKVLYILNILYMIHVYRVLVFYSV